jgi:hypothetical protein
MNRKLENLIKLLDDENQQSASMIMAELLHYEPEEISEVLQKLQESDNMRLRKRVHQIQSILTTRKRRKNLSHNLQDKNVELINALMELHLQWYDNDSEENLRILWKELLASAQKNHPVTLEKLAYFMQKCGFSVSSRDDIEADYYCIGIVLDELVGSDFLVCSIAKAIASYCGLDLKIIQVIGDFALMDPDKDKALFPKNGWRVVQNFKKNHYKEWDSSMLLRLTSAMLFLCAVNTDSFRYINTIGTCLAKSIGAKDLSCLPYPYNS